MLPYSRTESSDSCTDGTHSRWHLRADDLLGCCQPTLRLSLSLPPSSLNLSSCSLLSLLSPDLNSSCLLGAGDGLSAGRMGVGGVGDNLHSCPWGLPADFKQIARVSACLSSLHKTWGLLGRSPTYCGNPWPTLWDAYSVSSDPFFLANRTSITFKITRCLTSSEVLTFPASLVSMRDHP